MSDRMKRWPWQALQLHVNCTAGGKVE